MYARAAPPTLAPPPFPPLRSRERAKWLLQQRVSYGSSYTGLLQLFDDEIEEGL